MMIFDLESLGFRIKFHVFSRIFLDYYIFWIYITMIPVIEHELPES